MRRALGTKSVCAVLLCLALASAPARAALCWGSLYVVSRSTHTQVHCPTPTLTKTWRIRCYDGCGYQDGSFDRSLTGFGECFKNPSCRAPQIICLPLAGSDIYGHNPPSLSSAIVNRMGYYRSPPCSLPGCRTAGVSSMTVYCNCASDQNPVWCAENDPLIVSLGDAHYELTDRAEGVEFDLGANGTARQVPWTDPGSDEAFLALDRDGSGTIDDGTELFGDATPQHVAAEPNGFRALAMFDDVLSGGNEDGGISAADEVYARLWLWLDADHDGRSRPEELLRLAEVGLEWIGLDFGRSGRVDRHGNEFRFRAESRWSDGSRRPVWNVFLTAE